MLVVCLDLEGVLIPEVWVNVAKSTGIDSLLKTTRDEPDYNRLMSYRLRILEENSITIEDISRVIESMNPLDGGASFLKWLEVRWPTIILSDTFSQFADPIMGKLGYPTLFCHELKINQSGNIIDWAIRSEDHKRKTVKALKRLNFDVIAVGDSYNDTTMLSEANKGILFRPPENVIREFPQFSVSQDYEQLKNSIESFASDMG